MTIASYATDGVSYIATDKSVTDHMLSDALGQNCAVWRILRGRSICKDFTPAEVAARAKARRETRHDDVRGQIAQIEGPGSPSGVIEGTAIAQAPNKAANKTVKPGTGTEKSKVTIEELTTVAPAAGGAAIRPRVLAATAKTAPTKAGKASAQGKSRPISGTLAGTAKAKPARNTLRLAAVRRSARPARPARRTQSSLQALRRFIVFGSFRNRRAAARLARRHQILDPFVVPARVRGTTYYRVVTQPEDRASIAMTFRALKRAGVQDAYAIRACRTGHVNSRCLRQVPRRGKAAPRSIEKLLLPERSVRPGQAAPSTGS